MSDLAYKLGLVDSYGLTMGGFLGILAGGILLVLAVVFCAVTYGGRSYGRTTCANWSSQTGIQTKFVILNWADSGTCLARTPGGRWVLNSKWQAFVNAGRSKP